VINSKIIMGLESWAEGYRKKGAPVRGAG
jgi:hypothetical protein